MGYRSGLDLTANLLKHTEYCTHYILWSIALLLGVIFGVLQHTSSWRKGPFCRIFSSILYFNFFLPDDGQKNDRHVQQEELNWTYEISNSVIVWTGPSVSVGLSVLFPQLYGKCQSVNHQRPGTARISVSFRHIVGMGTVCCYVHCIVLWVMLRFNWMMYCCHRVSANCGNMK